MARKFMVLLATLGLAGGMMFQVNGCATDSMIGELGSFLGGSSFGYDASATGTVDPLGIDIDLPYFDEGDYFEVPAYLF